MAGRMGGWGGECQGGAAKEKRDGEHPGIMARFGLMLKTIHSHKVTKPRNAVFLDRDGTLINDADYLRRIQDIRWIPGVVESLQRLQDNGYALVVISNQSGIARGYFDVATLQQIESTMDNYLRSFGVTIDAWYYCPHHPDQDGPCECRKPGNALIEAAIADLGIRREGSWMVGDSMRDVQAGLRSGLRSALVRTGKPVDMAKVPAGVNVYRDFAEFVKAMDWAGVAR